MQENNAQEASGQEASGQTIEIRGNRHQKRALLGALKRAKRQAAKQRARKAKAARNG